MAARRCNLCGAAIAPAHSVRWYRDGLAIAECPSCGLLFRRDLPTRQEVLATYADPYWKRDRRDTGGQGYLDYLADEELHRLNARKRLTLIEHHTSPGSLLDLGCAAGFFLDEARRRGWQVHGVELSASMSAYGRRELDLPIETAFFGDVELDLASLDCVTMWDYIEHSLDPAGDVEKAARALKPGGLLTISTGDAASLVARVSGRRWHLLVPAYHMFFFTPPALRRLLERAGLAVEHERHAAAWYPVRYLMHKLRTMAPRSRTAQWSASWFERRRIGRLAVPMNLWDIVTVIARKP